MLNFRKGRVLNMRKQKVSQYEDYQNVQYLDLGGGTSYGRPANAPEEGYVSIDVDPEEAGPDIVHDLNEGIPLPDNSVTGRIRLGNMVYQLDDPIAIARDVIRVASPGAEVEYEESEPIDFGKPSYDESVIKTYNEVSMPFLQYLQANGFELVSKEVVPDMVYPEENTQQVSYVLRYIK